MSAVQFSLYQPASLAEAMDLLSTHRSSVRLLTGGTDLAPKLKTGALKVQNLVSLRWIPGLDQVRFSPEEGLHIGGAARLSQVAELPEARELYPALAHACSVMATTQIRNMGSVAGNIANAAPSADTAAPLLVYDAEVEAQSQNGSRRIALADFFAGPGLTVLEPGEIIVAVRAPAPQPPCASQYLRLSARSKVDIAAVGMAGLVGLDADGRVGHCRLALAAVAPTPLRCRQAENLLLGQLPEPKLLDQVAAAAAAICCPIDDVRASAAYRLAMAEVLARRVLTHCVERAQGGVE
ncbi:MAG: xanthine dehydrogenase family protein subunit M [Pseudomonadota bacterium]